LDTETEKFTFPARVFRSFRYVFFLGWRGWIHRVKLFGPLFSYWSSLTGDKFAFPFDGLLSLVRPPPTQSLCLSRSFLAAALDPEPVAHPFLADLQCMTTPLEGVFLPLCPFRATGYLSSLFPRWFFSFWGVDTRTGGFLDHEVCVLVA